MATTHAFSSTRLIDIRYPTTRVLGYAPRGPKEPSLTPLSLFGLAPILVFLISKDSLFFLHPKDWVQGKILLIIVILGALEPSPRESISHHHS